MTRDTFSYRINSNRSLSLADEKPLDLTGSQWCFQEYREFVKEDLLKVVSEFHKNGKISKATNSIFILLTPKKTGTKSVSDYRPISLVTGPYNIVSKLLSNRLKKCFKKS